MREQRKSGVGVGEEAGDMISLFRSSFHFVHVTCPVWNVIILKVIFKLYAWLVDKVLK
jgi:hypothetical protein